MSNEPDPKRLAALEAKLKAARGPEEAQTATGDDTYSQAGLAWQMIVELVVGLGIGFGIGYAADTVFGTEPIFMVLFILLGFAAGVKVMLGTATQMQKQQAANLAAEKEED